MVKPVATAIEREMGDLPLTEEDMATLKSLSEDEGDTKMSEVIDYPGTFYRPPEVVANGLVWYIQGKTELVTYDGKSVSVVANMNDDLSGVTALYVLGNPGNDKWIDMTVDGDIVIRWTDADDHPRTIHVGVAIEPTAIEALLQMQDADKTSGLYI